MDDDLEWPWEPQNPPQVDYDDPPEIGRIYGPDGSLVLIVRPPRRPFGFVSAKERA